MSIIHLLVLTVGVVIGFLGGLFGKGGSAIATPLLSLIGIPGFVAVAAPLPATIPGTFVASAEYWKSHLLDWQIIIWSVTIGTPATILGSYLTEFTGSKPLLVLTGVLVLGFGLSFLFSREKKKEETAEVESSEKPPHWRLRLILVATGVGFVSGLLANSGGFLLAPSYAKFLDQPIKKAFACSLAVSMVLAIPGTVVHAWLGHIDWVVTLFLAAGSVPFSYLGAKVAIKARGKKLERWYGVVLTALGVFFLSQL